MVATCAVKPRLHAAVIDARPSSINSAHLAAIPIDQSEGKIQRALAAFC